MMYSTNSAGNEVRRTVEHLGTFPPLHLTPKKKHERQTVLGGLTLFFDRQRKQTRLDVIRESIIPVVCKVPALHIQNIAAGQQRVDHVMTCRVNAACRRTVALELDALRWRPCCYLLSNICWW